MARSINRLSARTVAAASQKGLFADGGGLYLQVGPSGNKSWLFRFTLNGRAREMGLGPIHTVSLAAARIQAEKCRRLLHQKIDPIAARDAERARLQIEASDSVTFKQCAERYIAAHERGWRNAKHAKQWTSTLNTYAYPVLGNLPVRGIDTGTVLRVLEPIWQTKTETATRVRGRIEAVLDWASARGYRNGDNPARWRGHLDKLLPSRSKIRKVVHHAALPYDELGAFMRDLRSRDSVAARGLEFQILTAARSGEVIGARWQEVDLIKKVWTVPAERMKAGKEHRVPLSTAAVTLLKRLKGDAKPADHVFPGANEDRPLSNMAFLQLLKRMNREDLTAHGFRSTFRDWAAELTSFPREVAEMALAHTIEDKVEAAYRRGDLFEKRRQLMEAWARHCATAAAKGKVVPIGRAQTKAAVA
ncbi:site-specific integrase [uncultured Ferrovibrio sp.]|jgi:Integrase|uniref:tyrosine-type recombinase/integrase n=1 Tax=uncultured Ferrovibrio sp. TaxID=1576913 RepID=UPI0026098FBF|nr:site-specific integrase [uncultured Ferrovibrio sp.]